MGIVPRTKPYVLDYTNEKDESLARNVREINDMLDELYDDSRIIQAKSLINLPSLTAHGVVVGEGTALVTATAPGAAHTVLHGNGSLLDPTFSAVNLTNDVTGTLPVGSGGTGTATAFTPGSVVFAGTSGIYAQNNAQLFWDNTNNRLGIGSASPSYPFVVEQAMGAGDQIGALFHNSTATGNIFIAIASVIANFRGAAFGWDDGTRTTIQRVLGDAAGSGVNVAVGGKVGIQTNNPAVDLHLDKSSGPTFRLSQLATSVGTMDFALDSGAVYISSQAAALPIVFRVNNVEKMRLVTNGLAIRATSLLGSDIHRVGDGTAAAYMSMDGSAGGGAGYTLRSAGTTEAALQFVSPDTYLDYSGTLHIRASAGGTDVWDFDSGGAFHPNTNNGADLGTSSLNVRDLWLGRSLQATTVGPHVFGTSTDSRAILTIGGVQSGSASESYGELLAPTVTPAVNNNGYSVRMTNSFTKAGSGTHIYAGTCQIEAPGFTGGAAAVTNAASLILDAAPTGGSKNYAMLVKAGLANCLGGVATIVKAGTPVDGDYNTPTDGTLVVDSTGSKIWARVGGVWKGVAIA